MTGLQQDLRAAAGWTCMVLLAEWATRRGRGGGGGARRGRRGSQPRRADHLGTDAGAVGAGIRAGGGARDGGGGQGGGGVGRRGCRRRRAAAWRTAPPTSCAPRASLKGSLDEVVAQRDDAQADAVRGHAEAARCAAAADVAESCVAGWTVNGEELRAKRRADSRRRGGGARRRSRSQLPLRALGLHRACPRCSRWRAAATPGDVDGEQHGVGLGVVQALRSARRRAGEGHGSWRVGESVGATSYLRPMQVLPRPPPPPSFMVPSNPRRYPATTIVTWRARHMETQGACAWRLCCLRVDAHLAASENGRAAGVRRCRLPRWPPACAPGAVGTTGRRGRRRRRR